MKSSFILKTSRENQLQQLEDPNHLWDVLVIGGGATGLGIALDSISRGYKTLLVEQSDFAKGTSSRSTKLIHGGVRYLAQGDVRLVREASIERGLLCRNAPHLVKNQAFIIPVYSTWDKYKYTVGLKLYDWIAGKFSLGSSVFISRNQTLEALPGIKQEGLLGGVRYQDGQFDDARLAINLAQTIIEKGGTALNYVRVMDLIKVQNKIMGAVLQDVETDKLYEVKARSVINATGVFVDDILRMDNPSAKKTICVSQGVHVVLDKKFFPAQYALMIPETSDGRVLFAVPWHDKLVLGTTDTPVAEASLEPRALEEEIDFILETAGEFLTVKPERIDILSIFAGLRPLAAPKKDSDTTKEISRSHKITVSPSGLFTMLGGKWTTFRKMGEDMMDYIEKHSGWKHKRSKSAAIKIHGASSSKDVSGLFAIYGSDAAFIKQNMNGSDDQWLSTSLHIHKEQVRWAVEHEMARTLEDVLSRRTRTLLLDAAESIRIAEPVARYMATLLNKDELWILEQLDQYKNLANQYLYQHKQPGAVYEMHKGLNAI
jgi:glycerol-3-phosphate dehydrogenase